jgi:hypothetical protein
MTKEIASEKATGFRFEQYSVGNLTHQVPRNFFSNFSTIFGYSTPQDPQKTNP